MLITSIGQGLLWAPLVIGVFLTFRILNIPDLTTEGSFPLGAAVTISSMLAGQSAIVASLLGFVAGCLAGWVTGVLDTKLKMPSLLAGILTMTGLYSINMHIMGKANIPLLDQKTLMGWLPANSNPAPKINTPKVVFFILKRSLKIVWFAQRSSTS